MLHDGVSSGADVVRRDALLKIVEMTTQELKASLEHALALTLQAQAVLADHKAKIDAINAEYDAAVATRKQEAQ